MSYKSKEKLVQFYHACKQNLDIKYIKRILDSEGDINYQIFDDNSHFTGYTALHFAAKYCSNVDVFNLLLVHGADFTMKDSIGSTAISLAMADFYDKYNKSPYPLPVVPEVVNAVLEAHVTCKNAQNPSDNNGISHFHVACMTKNSTAVEFFLSSGAPVDGPINEDSPIFPGYTPLHLAAQLHSFQTFSLLIQYGAKGHFKNAHGLTALHILLENRTKADDILRIQRDQHTIWELRTSVMILESLLNEHDLISIGDTGLTRLHIMCALSDKLTDEFLSKYNGDIDHSVKNDAQLWPGYTALHFAAYSNMGTIKLLLNRGANLFARDLKGVTSLELLIKGHGLRNIFSTVMLKHVDITMSDGKTKLVDVISVVHDITASRQILEKDKEWVNLFVPHDSPLWPGYTILHLAINFRNNNKTEVNTEGCLMTEEDIKKYYLKVILMLLNSGADIELQDVRGITPVGLAFCQEDAEIVNLLLNYNSHTILPSDQADFENLSHLHIACATGNENFVGRLLWPNPNVNSPVLCALKWPSTITVCPYHNDRNCVFSIPVNSTPLHVSVGSGHCKIAKTLMNYNADLYARDVNGMTPIHRILPSCNPHKLGEILLSAPDLENCVVGNTGFSHLHVASFVGNVDAVKRLLDKGADVNASITYHPKHDDTSVRKFKSREDSSLSPLSFLSKYNSFTALDFAGAKMSYDMAKLLLERGATLSKSVIEQHMLFKLNLTGFSIFDLIKSLSIQGQMKLDDQGITMLHIACHQMDVEMVESLLKSQVDVNARVPCGSRLWPGCTPLHVLLIQSKMERLPDRTAIILELLYEFGADVTISNAQGETPLLIDKVHLSLISLLLNCHRNFDINPANKKGMSHFHVACFAKETAVVREFLRHGVNVDQPIDFFDDNMPGFTPLHLALAVFDPMTRPSRSYRLMSIDPRKARNRTINSNELETVGALLQHGANVNAKDAQGSTPLHYGARHLGLRKIMYNHIEADFNVQNVFGQTPLEMVLSNDVTTSEVEYFINSGFDFNIFNSITEQGYIGMICERSESSDEILNLLAGNPNAVSKLDYLNRAPIHNIVSSRRINNPQQIHIFLGQGCNIDNQDALGRTPLHIATKFQNSVAVSALLGDGADINVIDVAGQSALVYISEVRETALQNHRERLRILHIFAVHATKLNITGLFMTEHNRIFMVRRGLAETDDQFIQFFDQLTKTRDIKVGSDSLSLFDFLSETGAVTAYSHMTYLKRLEVNEFFMSFDFTPVPEVKCLLKLQYRKALARCQLIEPAKASFRTLLEVAFPDVCMIAILRYLPNEDLKNMVVSTA